MNTSYKENLLVIHLEGRPVTSGRIPLDFLVKLLGEFRKALFRTGMVLQGDADSVRRGKKPKSLMQSLELDLVRLTHGSPSTVLCFDQPISRRKLPETDFGLMVLEKSITGLSHVQKSDPELPFGYDQGVLRAWRDLGFLFEKDIKIIGFTLNHRTQPIKTIYTPDGYMQIQQRIRAPLVNMQTIEGRLLMADFKEHGTRCRIHPSAGDPVLCLFDDEQKDEIFENILRYVKVIGEATVDPLSNKISSIKIADIERLEELEDKGVDLLPEGTPLPSDFWHSPSFEELADAQNISPLVNVEALFGTWPGEENDGFEELIRDSRQFGLR